MTTDDIQTRTVEILQDYLKIATINPPGRERPAAEFLAKILGAAGLETQTLAAEPDRPNLICRLRGDGSRGPLILLHHMDVVPVERDQWQVDPFGGEIRDGFLWGRGAIDMKGLGVMELIAFLMAARGDVRLKRDLVYIAVADEETGGSQGAQWLTHHHPEACRAEFLLNEGGVGWKRGDQSGFDLGVGEKGPLWLRLWTEGPPGHGSVPLENNACLRLVRALDRIGRRKPQTIITPEMRPFLQAHGLSPEMSADELAGHPLLAAPAVAARFQNTVSLTGLTAGQKVNVIPSRAEATLDCRLLPGTGDDAFLTELRGLMDDPAVRVEIINSFPASSSPADTPMVEALRGILGREYPGVRVVPTLSTGFTDSRCFRALGVHAYGLMPILVELPVLACAHGHNERIPLAVLDPGVRVVFDLIKSLNE